MASKWIFYYRGGCRNFWLGSPNFVSERPVEPFLWQIASHRDDHVFLNLWTPVARCLFPFRKRSWVTVDATIGNHFGNQALSHGRWHVPVSLFFENFNFKRTEQKKKLRSHGSTFVEFDYTFYFVNTQCRDPTRLNNTIPEIKCESLQAPGGRVYNSSEKISLNFFENYSPTDSICIFLLSLRLEE